MATLYIISTPIGNLEDITKRALRILSEVDLILAEDTRVTRKLLSRYQINKPLISYHQHSQLQKVDYILKLLREGKNLALVSDAGTPGISDPGNLLIEKIIQEPVEGVKVVPIPGPSALTAAVSVSGFPMDRFLFLGFPPAKKKRKRFFEEAVNSRYPVVFYESRYRVMKTLGELKLAGIDKAIRVVICQELTKMFEITYRGRLEEVIVQMNEKDLRGEFVIIINPGVK